MTTRQITDALLVGKQPIANRQQTMVLQAAVLAILRRRDGTAVVGGDTVPQRWKLKRDTN
jgi:hypothetical protein